MLEAQERDHGSEPAAPESLSFLQLQDAFKRMVAVGVDVVDEQVRSGSRGGVRAAGRARAPQVATTLRRSKRPTPRAARAATNCPSIGCTRLCLCV